MLQHVYQQNHYCLLKISQLFNTFMKLQKKLMQKLRKLQLKPKLNQFNQLYQQETREAEISQLRQK